MSTIYTDPPQSRNEAIIKSTIDGTQYTDPPQSRMEDLLLELKEAIEQGGGGTTVVANPEGEATDDLEKLQVGSDIYEIPKDYEDLDNKPQINGETLDGNKTASDLGLQPTLDGAQTVEGNPITITDAEAMNAESVVVELEPKQDLHGYDKPWVGGSGKNLLPMTVDGIKTLNSSYTWVGNSTTINNAKIDILTDSANNVTGISISGTPNANVLNILLGIITTTSTTILTGFSGDWFANGLVLHAYEQGTASPEYITGDTGSVELPANKTYEVSISLKQDVVRNDTVYPMIRLSTETDPTFAPYSNVCPITGYSEVNVERVGKNLLNINASGIVENAMFDIQTLEIVGSENYDISDYIEVKEGVTYKYSRVADVLSVPCGVFYDKDKNPISLVTNIFTMTIPSGIKYVRLELLKVATNQQLEVGSSKTTYEPYQGNTYTIDLDGTKYGGTLDVTSGVLTVDRAEVEYDGGIDESWSKFGSGSASAFAMIESTTIANIDQNATPISNELQGVNRNDTWGNYHDFVSINASYEVGRGQITCGIDTITTVEDWITFLSNNPLKVVCKLATPLTIQLTPTQIQMLENTNNISTDGTNITLKYQPNNVIGECKVYTDEKCSEVLPPLPTTDGTYHLSCEVTSGAGELSWVSDS